MVCLEEQHTLKKLLLSNYSLITMTKEITSILHDIGTYFHLCIVKVIHVCLNKIFIEYS